LGFSWVATYINQSSISTSPQADVGERAFLSVTVGDSTGETVSLGEIAGLHTNAQLVLDPIHKQNTESDQSDDTRLYQLAKSPIRFNKVEESLINYPRKYEAIELIEGLKHGFPLQYSGTRLPFNTKNLRSVYEKPDLVKANIKKEVSLDRVVGPFTFRPFPTLRVSPIEIVPKNDGDFRMIHHLSHPTHYSFEFL
jgi:hypothetical protein